MRNLPTLCNPIFENVRALICCVEQLIAIGQQVTLELELEFQIVSGSTTRWAAFNVAALLAREKGTNQHLFL